MNIKTILASTLLTALFAGQSAFAAKNDFVISNAIYQTTIQSVALKTAIFTTTKVKNVIIDENRNR